MGYHQISLSACGNKLNPSGRRREAPWGHPRLGLHFTAFIRRHARERVKKKLSVVVFYFLISANEPGFFSARLGSMPSS